jgi:membrane-bound lytic murein transglycosylase D
MLAHALLLALAVLAACSPPRGGALQAPAPSLAPEPAASETPVAQPQLPCLTDPMIDAWEYRLREQQRFRAHTDRIVARATPYLPRIREILAEAELPASLALLPAIESSFAPRVCGYRDSCGLWQLRKPTARRFGLVVRRGRDERYDPERATLAAARYLRFLYKRYGDWPLALAAYNAGEGRIDRALMRNPGATFWELARSRHLSHTSRNYVPRFLALLRLVEPQSTC